MDIRERLIRIINSWKGKKIAVIGDIMIDEYIIGKIERISPEAPVPVLEIEEEKYVLGGAGNVANNIKALGGEPLLFGVVGEDIGAEKILNLLNQREIKNFLVKDKERPTTTKTRLIALSQQVVRMDKEKRNPIKEEIEMLLLEKIKENIEKIDIFLLSDYAKGVLTYSFTKKIIELAKTYGKKILVDPKGKDFTKYKGASYITPNEKEAKIATDMEENFDIIICAQKLLELIEGEGVIITRGEKGMFLYLKDSYYFIPALKAEVRDVTGAGDTVISALTLAISSDANPLEAALISNFAGSVVVRKLGTSTLSPEEIIQVIPQKINIDKNYVEF
ncbi:MULTISPECIES: D-glycero-beta-D-manno-heptose-7-phosphate kinase [Dictyoglomus]|jgi:rfaE bifunctional protein kinase chain/domain|uniref:RfaE bifunctional protein n=1 Tax=Dictyoglomus turgidum (strain DSM 6724 / Z-1310) TaxID=515635 RepID=B8DZR8_DICTD|nr:MULTISPECIES: D-glycero-beta-D-manno-heptose-7-phosphate kinase [Dictyoglomus]ACK42001.1 rfaE bifunctional protein [Dictyoglomus turgidum DSM 6724]PNV80912.1 MAG: D-glycero-beta-D-manno-heptose-7-phosphate kinase [Dictyoglomus turgidum]HBU31439.1 D-glycero-beta-D-manno-heptose-7-phosphate kinase [Dictyoglomus sp.]